MADDGDDVEAGLRFVHVLGMQTKLDTTDNAARLAGLVEELVARGVISLRSLEDRVAKARTEEASRVATQAVVQVGPSVDKYTVESPDIPCAELLHLCKARCCKLSFPLSFQDLDERVVKWDYARPYQIRKQPDGRCVHSEPTGCNVYAKRPAICRTYDCRKDTRVWVDFDKRIPAPEDTTDFVQIRKAPTSPDAAG